MSDFSTENLPRRDPRTEWILRNRLHPLHDSMLSAQQGEERGPTGLLRKNPHQLGFIGPNGLKRIDRANAAASSSTSNKAASAHQPLALPLHKVANPEGYIMVVPDMVGGRLSLHDKDILGLAHKLAGESGAESSASVAPSVAVVVVCFGKSKETQFDLAGVDRLIHLSGAEYEGFAPEARLKALLQINAQYQPQHWLFPDSVNGGTDLASRLGARLGERPATQAWQVTTSKTVCRGASASTDITRATPKILMLLEECGDPIDETRHEALPLELELDHGDQTTSLVLDKGLMAVDPNAVPLAEAEFILAAGNGIHNWQQFHQCASVLGATQGASRVVVDNGFMPRARQVGASGTWVSARVYVAVGISGAIQHLQGIGQCDKIIAINTDAGCDMVKRADLAVIGDSEAILAQLMQLAQQHKGLTDQEEKTHAA